MAAIAVAWSVADGGSADRVDASCIGVHFWLRTKVWYLRWRPFLLAFALVLPTGALAGYVTAGNQVLRAAANSDYASLSLKRANLTEQKREKIGGSRKVAWWPILP